MFDARTGFDGPPTAVAAGGFAVLASLDDVLGRVAVVCAEAARGASWTAGERAAALARLDRLAGALATVRGRLLLAEQAAGTGVADGDRDLAAARARVTRTGIGEARRELRQAATLAALPEVAGAVTAGRMPLPHLDALGRATAEAGERATAALTSPEGQARLVRMAERLGVREFAGAVSRLVASYEPEALERGHAAQRAARFLVLSRQPDGVHVRGRLDLLAGAVLRGALDAVGLAPDEDRDKAQADADALVAVAERSMSGMARVRGGRGGAGDDEGRVSVVAGRPLISVLVPVETFAALKAARRRAAGGAAGSVGGGDAGEDGAVAGGGGAGKADGVAGGSLRGGDGRMTGDHAGPDAGGPGDGCVPPAMLEDGTPVAGSELARLLCDAELGRVVVDAESVPLDLGRTSRLFSAAQRRAAIIRDRACAWNGCDVPAAYGELHHIRWWDRDGGRSDLANAVLLCSHHHHVVHRLDLSIVRVGGRDGPPVRYEFRRASGPRAGEVVSAPVAVAA